MIAVACVIGVLVPSRDQMIWIVFGETYCGEKCPAVQKWILDVRVALVCYEALFHLVLAVDMTAQVSPNSNVYLSETHHHVEES